MHLPSKMVIFPAVFSAIPSKKVCVYIYIFVLKKYLYYISNLYVPLKPTKSTSAFCEERRGRHRVPVVFPLVLVILESSIRFEPSPTDGLAPEKEAHLGSAAEKIPHAATLGGQPSGFDVVFMYIQMPPKWFLALVYMCFHMILMVLASFVYHPESFIPLQKASQSTLIFFYISESFRPLRGTTLRVSPTNEPIPSCTD